MQIILIVDGERSFHDLYSDILEDSGYIVISVYDRDEALSKMEEMKPDLIIIDELILMDIVLEKQASDISFIYTKSISEFDDIPFITTGDFLLRSYRHFGKVGSTPAYLDETFIKEKLIEEVNTKIEQKTTLCL
jgi:two-component SAPR family response regulator